MAPSRLPRKTVSARGGATRTPQQCHGLSIKLHCGSSLRWRCKLHCMLTTTLSSITTASWLGEVLLIVVLTGLDTWDLLLAPLPGLSGHACVYSYLSALNVFGRVLADVRQALTVRKVVAELVLLPWVLRARVEAGWRPCCPGAAGAGERRPRRVMVHGSSLHGPELEVRQTRDTACSAAASHVRYYVRILGSCRLSILL